MVGGQTPAGIRGQGGGQILKNPAGLAPTQACELVGRTGVVNAEAADSGGSDHILGAVADFELNAIKPVREPICRPFEQKKVRKPAIRRGQNWVPTVGVGNGPVRLQNSCDDAVQRPRQAHKGSQRSAVEGAAPTSDAGIPYPM